jgi:hypothetical protein
MELDEAGCICEIPLVLHHCACISCNFIHTGKVVWKYFLPECYWFILACNLFSAVINFAGGSSNAMVT